MKPELARNKDFWSGVMLILIGGAAMVIAREYRFGSAGRMGPGFFPIILGGILVAFGICLIAKGLRGAEKIQARLSFRALVLPPLALVLFGLFVERAGFIPALVVLIFGSAASGRAFRIKDVLLLTVTLVVGAVALFIWGLGLPYPLFKGF
jgi:hypothetical protein